MEKTPDWLKRIQENSWEPEILISGGVILTLFTLSDDFLNWYLDTKAFLGVTFKGQSIIMLLLIMALEGVKVLFLFHLIVRTYWVGVIGLSYAFPKGIKSEDFNYAGKFVDTLKDAKDINRYIEKIEYLASLIFTLTIRFVFSFVGFAFTLAILILCWHYSAQSIKPIILVLFSTGAAIYAFDVMTKFKLRNNKKIVAYYYPLYILISWLTLSFLYRPIFQIIYGNLKVKRVLPIALFVIAITFYTSYNKVNKSNLVKIHYVGKVFNNITENGYNPINYLNKWKNSDYKPVVQLGRDVVNEYPTLFVFIEYLPMYDEQLYELFSSDNPSPRDLRDSFRLFVDDNEFPLTDFVFGKNPDTHRLGLLGYINLSKSTAGKHDLKVWAHVIDDNQKGGTWEKDFASIPFWKD